jgi:hypothetical protein
MRDFEAICGEPFAQLAEAAGRAAAAGILDLDRAHQTLAVEGDRTTRVRWQRLAIDLGRTGAGPAPRQLAARPPP